jgi:hypothetical protein
MLYAILFYDIVLRDLKSEGIGLNIDANTHFAREASLG